MIVFQGKKTHEVANEDTFQSEGFQNAARDCVLTKREESLLKRAKSSRRNEQWQRSTTSSLNYCLLAIVVLARPV